MQSIQSLSKSDLLDLIDPRSHFELEVSRALVDNPSLDFLDVCRLCLSYDDYNELEILDCISSSGTDFISAFSNDFDIILRKSYMSNSFAFHVLSNYDLLSHQTEAIVDKLLGNYSTSASNILDAVCSNPKLTNIDHSIVFKHSDLVNSLSKYDLTIAIDSFKFPFLDINNINFIFDDINLKDIPSSLLQLSSFDFSSFEPSRVDYIFSLFKNNNKIDLLLPFTDSFPDLNDFIINNFSLDDLKKSLKNTSSLDEINSILTIYDHFKNFNSQSITEVNNEKNKTLSESCCDAFSIN